MIRKHATFKISKNSLSLRGTDIKQLGDILADITMIIPKRVRHGWVAYGPYLQAEEVYTKLKLASLIPGDSITISGHSLGAGVGAILAYFLRRDGYTGNIILHQDGALKCLSTKVVKFLENKLVVECNIRHRDPVPHIGFWKHIQHSTPKTGPKRKHFLDYDLAEHMKYWD